MIMVRHAHHDKRRKFMYKTYWVYILKCNDESYYTGVTNNIDGRIWEHNNDQDKKHYTYKRRPVMLVYCEDYNDINSAIAREKQIKGWTRKKKEALIKSNFNELSKLAKGKKDDPQYIKRQKYIKSLKDSLSLESNQIKDHGSIRPGSP
jgi:putative endonuclease